MDQATALVDQLSQQLLEADRLSQTRAEHLRLTRMQSTVDRLRSVLSETATVELAATA